LADYFARMFPLTGCDLGVCFSLGESAVNSGQCVQGSSIVNGFIININSSKKGVDIDGNQKSILKLFHDIAIKYGTYIPMVK
jgi:hypothetical protein